MKKLLSLFTTITLSTSLSTSVIACSDNNSNQEQDNNSSKIKVLAKAINHIDDRKTMNHGEGQFTNVTVELEDEEISILGLNEQSILHAKEPIGNLISPEATFNKEKKLITITGHYENEGGDEIRIFVKNPNDQNNPTPPLLIVQDARFYEGILRDLSKINKDFINIDAQQAVKYQLSYVVEYIIRAINKSFNKDLLSEINDDDYLYTKTFKLSGNAMEGLENYNNDDMDKELPFKDEELIVSAVETGEGRMFYGSFSFIPSEHENKQFNL